MGHYCQSALNIKKTPTVPCSCSSVLNAIHGKVNLPQTFMAAKLSASYRVELYRQKGFQMHVCECKRHLGNFWLHLHEYEATEKT